MGRGRTAGRCLPGGQCFPRRPRPGRPWSMASAMANGAKASRCRWRVAMVDVCTASNEGHVAVRDASEKKRVAPGRFRKAGLRTEQANALFSRNLMRISVCTLQDHVYSALVDYEGYPKEPRGTGRAVRRDEAFLLGCERWAWLKIKRMNILFCLLLFRIVSLVFITISPAEGTQMPLRYSISSFFFFLFASETLHPGRPKKKKKQTHKHTHIAHTRTDNERKKNTRWNTQ